MVQKALLRMKRRTLFLDIDGVLNIDGQCLDSRAIRQLRRLLSLSEAQIVLSSDCRIRPNTKSLLKSIFAAEDIPVWADETPVLSMPECRPWEIWLWLRNNDAAGHRLGDG